MTKIPDHGALLGVNSPVAVGGSLLDQLARDGARQMLAAVLLAEVAAYVDAHAGQVDGNGRRLVVRNGHHQPREVMTAAGAVGVRQPRVNDRRVDAATGERCRLSSAILPAWSRESPQLAEVLCVAVSARPVDGGLRPGAGAVPQAPAGLSSTTITRLAGQWQDDATAFAKRSLAGLDFVYMWVDGIHLKVRLEQDKVCVLVMIGVRADGRKELVALADGDRESTDSWGDVLREAQAPRDAGTGPGGRRWGAGVAEGRSGGLEVVNSSV